MRKMVLLMVSFMFMVSTPVQGAGVLSVQEAMNQPNGADVSVEGYIVGVPTAIDYVQQSNFTSNYALALADDPNETQVNDMIFVKLDAEYRSEYGLANNPGNMGKFIQVDGTRDPYFSHQGVEDVSSITTVSDDSNDGGDGGTDPAGYYENASGLSGSALKQALHNIIDDHTELSYSEVWRALRHTDEDPNNSNHVILLYSGDSLSKYDNGGNVDEWNREHVWAKSHGDFGTSMGPGTDIHHLRPTDVTVNSARGNLDFDNGGSAFSEAPDTYHDSDSWEPRDEVKGDVARMIFYMAVRYEGDSGELDLEVADYVGTSGPSIGKLTTLKQWHESDPVSVFEQHRNDIIFSDYQGNRNPFIDHPEYVERIW
ncbi:endonuclease [Halobacillus naozhouensis]|uniref:Endonuclease n=1 Tax=Halobacillus naozhouensis TaxID=554880 RepID=A0ABY8J1K0_9BACI|nr:endonuclease [Halobacillus naozhouensis]WFT76378.1 endonuclease [Halobacillus naozhouensis]